MYNSPNIAIAIKEQAKIKNVTVKTMLEDLGFGTNTLSSLYHGKMILADRLARIADYLDCSVDYLLGRQVSKAPSCVCQGQTREKADNVVIQHFRGLASAPMELSLHGENNEKSPAVSSEALRVALDYDSIDEVSRRAVRALLDVEKERTAEPEKVVDLGTIRHYLSRPAAGVGDLVEGEDYEDIPRTPDTPKNADYCLTVSGDSMEPYIKDGQLVYVERDAELDTFDVGVFCVNGATYVKQYCPTMPGVLMLLSANPEREDANIPILESSSDTVCYFGKVILPEKLPEPKYK